MRHIILPGLIDPHVHLRDPGQTEKEDFYTGTQAALAGGFTTVLDMPNNKIPIFDEHRLDEKIQIAKKKIVCDAGFYFGSVGDNIEEFPKAARKVFGLKLYLNETTGNFLIDKKKVEKILKAWIFDKPILLHAEDNAVEFVLKLVEKIPGRIHFCHISAKSDLEQIIRAKEKRLRVSCGVTPHHLFLNEHDAKTLGYFATMKPPLKSKKDVEFLWKQLKYIDCIESDHAPHTLDEKKSEKMPYGVPGLETTLPLFLNAVNEQRLTIDDIIRLCFKNPKKIFGIPTDENTKVEIDLSKSYTIENKNLFTKCKWSPFSGRKVKGKVIKVILHGETVFENGKILAKPGSGKVITPPLTY